MANCVCCRHKYGCDRWLGSPGLLYGEPVVLTIELMKQHSPMHNDEDKPGLSMLEVVSCLKYNTNLSLRPLPFTDHDITESIDHFKRWISIVKKGENLSHE
jgi:hypothetical protein